MRIVRSGLHPRREGGEEGELSYTLSPYYNEYVNHDPFIGTPDEQAHLAGRFSSLDDRERWARANETMRWGRLGWEHLRRNLELNQLVSQDWLRQVQVHYRFLGAYVHPTSEKSEHLLYGHNFPPVVTADDHYVSELVLLYSISIACSELRALIEFTKRAPQVGLSSMEGLRESLAVAEARSSHFWFAGGEPHLFDRVAEANHRGIRFSEGESVLVPKEGREPMSIPLDEIPYYKNPLERLRDMHRDFF